VFYASLAICRAPAVEEYVSSEVSNLISALISQVSAQVDKLDSELVYLLGLVEKHRHFNEKQRQIMEDKVAENRAAILRLSGAVSALEQALNRSDEIQRAQVSLEEKRIEADVRKTESRTEMKSALGTAVVGLLSGAISAAVTLFATNDKEDKVPEEPAQIEQQVPPAILPEEEDERPVQPVE
jgi:uncharacterized protein YbcI